MPQQLDHLHFFPVCVCVCVCVGHCSGCLGVRGAVSESMEIADTLLGISLLLGEKEMYRLTAI